MTTTISEYIDVRQRINDLGCLNPTGLALLPSNFEAASDISTFRQVSESATVKTLLRTSNVPLDELFSKEQRFPYIQNNAFEWVAPTLFVSVGLLSQNSSYLSLALSVIANYATDFFKGMSGENEVKMDIVVERTKSKVCKKVTYKGPPEGLKDLPEVIRAASDE
ncbi:hypothetical protein [Shewanella halotolerans]|uniref:hypothetical protein n=1 Tax=Shewanella halotolerans TaxID=2864204 RepID=UPI001C659117|nr:hypothetical protein [Shewanella halotolerans]QYJ91142.1 hypothetical protein K0H81_06030 [Shewanella halotolerans]